MLMKFEMINLRNHDRVPHLIVSTYAVNSILAGWLQRYPRVWGVCPVRLQTRVRRPAGRALAGVRVAVHSYMRL
jgi:hypothetical protein